MTKTYRWLLALALLTPAIADAQVGASRPAPPPVMASPPSGVPHIQPPVPRRPAPIASKTNAWKPRHACLKWRHGRCLARNRR